MLKRRTFAALAVYLLTQSQAWAGGGQAHFDLAQTPGSYILRNGATRVELKVDHPEVLKQALDTDPPDSSPNTPTLDTDDGVTVGAHVVELDLVTDCEKDSGDRFCDEDASLSVGVGNHLQFSLEKVVTRDKTTGAPAMTTASATQVGMKCNFVDKKGLDVAVYPTVTLNDATRVRNVDGTLAPSDGHVVYIPLMISKQIGPRTTVAANVGLGRSIEHADVNSMTMSIAIGRAVSATTKILAEVENQRSPQEKVSYVRFGWMKVISNNSSTGNQIAILSAIDTSVGRTPEGHARRAVRIGVVFTHQPASPAN